MLDVYDIHEPYGLLFLKSFLKLIFLLELTDKCHSSPLLFMRILSNQVNKHFETSSGEAIKLSISLAVVYGVFCIHSLQYPCYLQWRTNLQKKYGTKRDQVLIFAVPQKELSSMKCMNCSFFAFCLINSQKLTLISDSHLAKKIFYYLLQWKPFKNNEKYLPFHVFVLEIFSFLSWLFGYVGERFDEKAKVDFKIHDAIDWTKNWSLGFI